MMVVVIDVNPKSQPDLFQELESLSDSERKERLVGLANIGLGKKEKKKPVQVTVEELDPKIDLNKAKSLFDDNEL